MAGPIRRGLQQQLIARIVLKHEAVEIAIRPGAVARLVDPGFKAESAEAAADQEPPILLSVPVRLQRVGMEMKLLVDGAQSPRREPDRSLLRLLAMAQRFRDMVLRGDGKSMAELAGEAGVSPSYFTRVLRLGFLSPAIVKRILLGDQPIALTAKRLSLDLTLPNAWPDQLIRLGFR